MTKNLVFGLALVMATGSGLAQEKLLPYRTVVYAEPYSGTRVTTTYEKLADGTQIEHRKEEFEARNSQGWEVYKFTVEGNDPLTRNGHKALWTIIWDPVTHTRTDWCDCKKIAYRKQFGEPSVPRPKPESTVKQNGGEDPGFTAYLGPITDRLKYHVDHIDGQMIEGVETTGTKAVRVVKAGLDGNDHDLTTTVMSWYSPRLHIAMSTIIDDPMKGLKKMSLEHVTLADPDPTLFMVPSDREIQPSVPLPR